jgi:paraquat-inducible protein B
VLHSANAGSHGIGSPIFFRQLKVGEVTGARLADDGKSIVTNIFVDQQYVQYVDANSRFWNASGIDIKLDASGVRIDTQSLASILIGGIAFDSPHDAPTGAPVAAHTNFHLFVDRSSAMKNPETEVMKFALVFRETVRGLLPGAPVALRGVDIGEVIDVGLDVDVDSHIVVTRVTANLYPSRVHFHSRKPSVGAQRVKLIDDLVAHGMRAQLRPASLVTGQLFVALDFFSPQPKERVDWAANPPLMPTTPGNLQEIQTMLSSVAAKLDKLPLDEISKELRATIATANGMIRRLDAEVAPEARETLAQARKALGSVDRLLSNGQPATQEARDTMREVGRAAQSLRVLADYLERHPESLIRGKQEDQK